MSRKEKLILGGYIGEGEKFPVLRKDLIFQYFKYCKGFYIENSLGNGLKVLEEEGKDQVLKIIKDEIVDKNKGFSEAINELKTNYKSLMKEKEAEIEKETTEEKVYEIFHRLVRKTPDGLKEYEYDIKYGDDIKDESSHKVRNIVVIVTLAVVFLAVVGGPVLYYLLNRGSEEQQKQDQGEKGTQIPEDGKMGTEQTQSPDVAEADSQKSNKIKWIVGGGTTLVGTLGGVAAYGVNGSRSNSIKETKKGKENGDPLVYVNPVGNKDLKAESQNVTDNDKNIVEDDAAKASENLEKDKASENLENTETNEEKNEEEKEKAEN